MKNIFKTGNNNHYHYHAHENIVAFLHPLINFFSELEDSGVNTGEWLNNLEGSNVNIKDFGLFTRKEVQYYFKKYHLLKEKYSPGNVKKEPQFQRRLTGNDIENLITCCKEVIFEVTKACNLDCRYCIQGDLYLIHEKDQKINIDRNKAKLLLKYLSRYWSRTLSQERIGIKFYGGEPLLNFDAIREIVDYAKTLAAINEKFYYYITTNGVFLDRYLDYLVANNFFISISLDGNKDNNIHRISQDGEPSFEKITANIDLIRSNHPSYFEENVSFQSILHNKNSISEISTYFEKVYQKQPFMAEMTCVGVNKARKRAFERIYKSAYHNLYHGEDYTLLKNKKFKDLPKVPGIGIIAHNIYNWVLKYLDEPERTGENMTPTGTCHPFSKSIFLSTDGRILPCERIEHKFSFGYINDNVILDFEAIAERYNRFLGNMNQLCLSCSNAKSCKKCMFFCKCEEPYPVCNNYSSPKDFLQKLSDNVGYLENKPEIYFKHLMELIG
ncbi:MAG: radical SAM peptide maturase [Candidatus Aminicenantes bacterium]|nr:MAG: radical SAM peptide maturase [Candidatus Aminicenantes bacterium]